MRRYMHPSGLVGPYRPLFWGEPSSVSSSVRPGSSGKRAAPDAGSGLRSVTRSAARNRADPRPGAAHRAAGNGRPGTASGRAAGKPQNAAGRKGAVRVDLGKIGRRVELRRGAADAELVEALAAALAREAVHDPRARQILAKLAPGSTQPNRDLRPLTSLALRRRSRLERGKDRWRT